MLTTTKDYLSEKTKLRRVVFALFDNEGLKAFEDQLKTIQDHKK